MILFIIPFMSSHIKIFHILLKYFSYGLILKYWNRSSFKIHKYSHDSDIFNICAYHIVVAGILPVIFTFLIKKAHL